MDLVINTFFLYIIQPILFNLRIEKIKLSKNEISALLPSLGMLSPRKLPKVKELMENEEIAKLIMKKGYESLSKEPGGFFELKLVKNLMTTFLIIEQDNSDSYQEALLIVKERMLNLLLR